MQLGKLASRGLVSAVAPGQLVHITDQFTQRRFLVDTGAAYSVFPHSSSGFPSGPALSGATGQPIPCWGEQQLHLSFGGQDFSWPFLLAAVQFPIIGVVFYAILVFWLTRLPTNWLTGTLCRFSRAVCYPPLHQCRPPSSSPQRVSWMNSLFPLLTGLYVLPMPQPLRM
jgi:hypothetical protein